MKMGAAQMVEHLLSMREVKESIPHISILLLGSMYFILLLFGLLLVSNLVLKVQGKVDVLLVLLVLI